MRYLPNLNVCERGRLSDLASPKDYNMAPLVDAFGDHRFAGLIACFDPMLAPERHQGLHHIFAYEGLTYSDEVGGAMLHFAHGRHVKFFTDQAEKHGIEGGSFDMAFVFDAEMGDYLTAWFPHSGAAMRDAYYNAAVTELPGAVLDSEDMAVRLAGMENAFSAGVSDDPFSLPRRRFLWSARM